MIKFKPQLLPNDKAGETINWRERIQDFRLWLLSNKYDGARLELYANGTVTGRSLKSINNTQITSMAEVLANTLPFNGVIEAEFWAPNMTFSEIMHFFKTQDVTSEHTVGKYRKMWEKTGGNPAKGWKYPGRDVEWLTTWHPHLKFYVFDHLTSSDDDRTKIERYNHLHAIRKGFTDDLRLITQYEPESLDQIYRDYQASITCGGEGLVLMRKDSTYKHGRLTLNSGEGFKLKDSNRDYEGVIISVEEATEAREGSARTVNELGRSVTSKLKEDRIPSGLAKGFKVRMADGNEPTVSLNGFDHEDRRNLLKTAEQWIGETIKFTGMAPVKPGGCPRSAFYSKGNLRS